MFQTERVFKLKKSFFRIKKEAKKISSVLRLLGFSKGKHVKDYVRSFCSGRKTKPSIYLTFYFFFISIALSCTPCVLYVSGERIPLVHFGYFLAITVQIRSLFQLRILFRRHFWWQLNGFTEKDKRNWAPPSFFIFHHFSFRSRRRRLRKWIWLILNSNLILFLVHPFRMWSCDKEPEVWALFAIYIQNS